MKYFVLNSKNYQELEMKLTRFDSLFSYPLGEDSFTISHGDHYFKFFERMGELRYSGYEVNGEVVVVGASILRTINGKKVWYLCDLKVHPDFRGLHLTTKLMTRSFIQQYLKSSRCYGISMNSVGQKENRTSRILRHFGFNFFKTGPELNIYSVGLNELEGITSTLTDYKGNISKVSLEGIKDIILKSTSEAMSLIHLEFNKEHIPSGKPCKDSQFMFSSVVGSGLSRALEEKGIEPSASATIIHHGMDNWDWGFVHTSEI